MAEHHSSRTSAPKVWQRRIPTSAEMAFADMLRALRIPYASQRLVRTAGRCFVLGFVVRMSPRVIFEIGEGHRYDAQRTRLILATGTYRHFRLVRIANAAVFDGSARAIVAAIYPRQFARWVNK